MWSKRSTNSAQRLTARLRSLEQRLENFIEGNAARLFPTVQTQSDLATSLVQAMQAGIESGPDGALIGPNLFTLSTSPEWAAELNANPILLEGLTQAIQDESNLAGLYFQSPLAIRIQESFQLLPGQYRVQATHSRVNLGSTAAMETQNSPPAETAPLYAFLIVDGVQVFPLTQPVINIGRRPDNHLVIDDTRISRLHAQLRAVHGQYVIFDLDSTGGTWVNGEKVRQRTLIPGDVVSLSGVPLVYGQETSYPEDTQKVSLSD
jgi:hypothetical protein